MQNEANSNASRMQSIFQPAIDMAEHKRAFVAPDCLVCWEQCLDKLSVSTKCGHVLHTDCFHSWLKKKKECPVCFAELTSKDVVSVYFKMDDDESKKLWVDLKKLDDQSKKMKNKYDKQKIDITNLTTNLTEAIQQNTRIAELEAQLQSKEISTNELKKSEARLLQFESKETEAQELEDQLKDEKAEVKEQDKKIAKYKADVKTAIKDSQDLEDRIQDTKAKVKQRNTRIAELEENFQSLEKVTMNLEDQLKKEQLDFQNQIQNIENEKKSMHETQLKLKNELLTHKKKLKPESLQRTEKSINFSKPNYNVQVTLIFKNIDYTIDSRDLSLNLLARDFEELAVYAFRCFGLKSTQLCEYRLFVAENEFNIIDENTDFNLVYHTYEDDTLDDFVKYVRIFIYPPDHPDIKYSSDYSDSKYCRNNTIEDFMSEMQIKYGEQLNTSLTGTQQQIKRNAEKEERLHLKDM